MNNLANLMRCLVRRAARSPPLPPQLLPNMIKRRHTALQNHDWAERAVTEMLLNLALVRLRDALRQSLNHDRARGATHIEGQADDGL